MSKPKHAANRTETPRSAVVPSADDPFLASATPLIGGPWGRRAAAVVDRTHFFTLPRVLIFLTLAAGIVGIFTKHHCLAQGWGSPGVFLNGCYSDWTALYGARGLADNPFAPFTTDSFEYPVLMSVVASFTSLFVPQGDGGNFYYFLINYTLVFALWVATVLLTAATARLRPWDAAMVAVAPGIVLAGSINWDMWAVFLLAAAMWACSRQRPILCGVFIGLGTAMKLYPLFLLGALLVLAVRQRQWLPFARITAAAAGSWLLVNVPLMLGNWAAFIKFYEFSAERSGSWSSLWHVFNVIAQRVPALNPLDAAAVGKLSTGLFALSCALIFIWGIRSRQQPRLAQLMFLIVAAFTLFNKVYSPQFVMWLIPLFALAIGRWLMFLVWQIVEVLHFYAVWALLARHNTVDWPEAHKFPESVYVVAVLAHMACLVWMTVQILRDNRHPQQDPILRVHGADPGYQLTEALVATNNGARWRWTRNITRNNTTRNNSALRGIARDSTARNNIASNNEKDVQPTGQDQP